jgi:hypothetical protein
MMMTSSAAAVVATVTYGFFFFCGRAFFGLRRMTSFNQLSVIRQGGNIYLRAAAANDVAIILAEDEDLEILMKKSGRVYLGGIVVIGKEGV